MLSLSRILLQCWTKDMRSVVRWSVVTILCAIFSGATASSVLAGGLPMATPVLIASVGPGSTMTLQTSAGKQVRTVKAGSYTFLVRDRSAIRAFRLSDANVNTRDWETDLAFVGTVRWRVRLRAGVYRYVSVGQPILRGSFRVT